MPVLVIAELSNAALGAATRNAATAAFQLGGDIDILVAGSQGAASEAAKMPGVRRVLLADAPNLAAGLAEPLAPLIVELAPGYSHVVAASTSFGKNLLPRVAALLDVAQISDAVAVVSADTFVRPIYAGNALVTVRSSDPIRVVTIRTTAFAEALAEGGSAPVESIAAPADPGLSRFLSLEASASSRPDLTAAKVVVSGGRGLQSKENFHLIDALADRLGAAVGASRAAVDSGYAPNDLQVGQTGKIVAPDLYIAIGISGAIQHLAGMKDSKVIVAINEDEEAPIFQIADYGLVADLFTAVPELTTAL